MLRAIRTFCSTSSTDVFCSVLNLLMISNISSTSSGASPSEGSSSIITFGVALIAPPFVPRPQGADPPPPPQRLDDAQLAYLLGFFPVDSLPVPLDAAVRYLPL